MGINFRGEEPAKSEDPYDAYFEKRIRQGKDVLDGYDTVIGQLKGYTPEQFLAKRDEIIDAYDLAKRAFAAAIRDIERAWKHGKN